MAFSASALYKPEPRIIERSRRRARTATKRRDCRRVVYDRAGGCCEECGRPLILRSVDARHESEIANIHEVKPRSLGGDPTDPKNCQCLCCDCHRKAHGQ